MSEKYCDYHDGKNPECPMCMTQVAHETELAAPKGVEFVSESNRIEGITRSPSNAEICEFHRFMKLKRITIAELQKFVSVYQPGAVLRDRAGFDVRVGNYVPPRGGPEIKTRLEGLLDCCESSDPHFIHVQYETLHPFTDGNGRSGRMLWAWMMREFPLGFLHHFYYQTLAASGERH